jgi:hypothetical protein
MTLNWMTSRKSLFAGCSQSIIRTRSVFCSSVDFLQPMCKLTSFGPSGFDEQIKHLQKGFKAVGFLIAGALEYIAMVD